MALEDVEEVDVVFPFGDAASDLRRDEGRDEIPVVREGKAAIQIGQAGGGGGYRKGEWES